MVKQLGESPEPQPEDAVVEQPPKFPRAIAAALVALQAEVRTLKKTAENDHFKNTYAQLSDVQEAALPLLTKHGLALTQWPITVNEKHVLRSFLLHESGESVEYDTELLLIKRDPQGMGSAITYTRRQTTMAILGLSANDDDDGNRASSHLPPPTQEQLDNLAQLASDLKFSQAEINKRLATIKTEDQATVAHDNLMRIMSDRAASIKARNAASQSIVVSDVERQATNDEIKTSDRANEIRKRIIELNLKNGDVIRELIQMYTGHQTLAECKVWDLKKLEDALTKIEGGKLAIPNEWYATPPGETAVIPPEPTA